jgi:hypothetical protein
LQRIWDLCERKQRECDLKSHASCVMYRCILPGRCWAARMLECLGASGMGCALTTLAGLKMGGTLSYAPTCMVSRFRCPYMMRIDPGLGMGVQMTVANSDGRSWSNTVDYTMCALC